MRLGFSRNLFCILRNIPTIASLLGKGHSCKCRIFARLIRCIYSLFYYSGGGKLQLVRGRGSWQVDHIVVNLNPYTVVSH